MATGGCAGCLSWLEMITTALQQKRENNRSVTMSRLVVVSNRIAPPDEHAPVPVALPLAYWGH